MRDWDAIVEIAERHPEAFLRGFFDAEGSVGVAVGSTLYISVSASNTDLRLLRFVGKLLERCGIRPKIYLAVRKGKRYVIEGRVTHTNKDLYRIIFERIEYLTRFASRIGFAIPRKMRKLEDALRIRMRYRGRRASEEWLRLYDKVNGRWVRRAR